jgi:D-amino-acid dehydrogenase
MVPEKIDCCMSKPDILVVGAGVIGVTTAYYLTRQGYAVQVIDKCREAAEECSFANGGFLSLGHAVPWAQPGIAKIMLQSLFKADSPARWRFDGTALQLRWLWQFFRHASAACFAHDKQALYHLAAYSKQCLQAVLDEHGFAPPSPAGVLQISQAASAAALFKKQHQGYQGTQVRSQMLANKAALGEVEPAFLFSPATQALGLNIVDDYAADCREFTRQMAQYLMTQGVSFAWETQVRGIRSTDSGVLVQTGSGEVQAGQAVVCAGVGSAALLKGGSRFMVYPVKGYALTAPVINTERAPAHPVLDADNRVAISRFGGNMRLTAVAEVAGHDTRIESWRLEQMKAAYERLFPQSVDWASAQPWVGLRPARPSSVPVIGPLAQANVFINTGHGALGWTLACGSASLLTQQLMRQPASIPIECYLPS